MTQLTSVLHYIGGQLDAGKQIDITYLDMSKAFDKEDHTKMLVRLYQYGITSKLHDGFRSYFTGTQATGYSFRSHFPGIAGYICGTTRVLIRADIVSVVCV